jgi:hypothetical protein
MNKRHPRTLSGWLAIMVCVAALQSAAQSLSRVAPEKVEKISSSLDKRLLPEGAGNLEVERSQVVAAPGITFVPVRFQAEDKSNDGGSPIMEGPPRKKFYCGMYQLVDDAPAKFMLVFGVGHTELEGCDGLQAIGAATPHAKYGDLILIYHAFTVHDQFPEPVILSWNDAQKQYVVNDNLSQFASTNSKKSYTISNIRSLLASRAAKP